MSRRIRLFLRYQPYSFWRYDKPGCKYRTLEDRKLFARWLGLERLAG